MLLKNIKLSGFKSFVDPTNFTFPSSLVGVLGPNGCGKSNVIDAVRWVMGESSAKNLRGDSMSDVIFNGSAGRQPTNQASVEMVFDNSNHTVGGEYAAYTEIAVRREVTRDGQSTYYLNGTKCRRKDVASVFLGTGLGPRSYSIIQQGTVSRLIESKPEELRTFLEEAAGISKYKERRRETSNRIKHTRENMERLLDVRLELEKHLAHLKRQANAAERFKVLKQEQRQGKAELYAMKWQEFEAEIKACEQQLAEKETLLEAQIANLRAMEAESEALRDAHIGKTDSFNEVQKNFYSVGGELGKIEQSIAHQTERQQQLTLDFNQTELHWNELSQSMAQDKQQLSDVENTLSDLSPRAAEAKQVKEEAHASLLQAEKNVSHGQEEWEQFTTHSAQVMKEAEVGKTQVQHIEQQLQVLAKRSERITEEHSTIQTDGLTEALQAVATEIQAVASEQLQGEQRVTDLDAALKESRQQQSDLQPAMDENKKTLRESLGRIASLEALQQAALGDKNKATQDWMESNSLIKNKRLAKDIEVESGWEVAVETVLGDYLQAICLDSAVATLADKLSELQSGNVILLSSLQTETKGANGTLGSKVTGTILPFLSCVYVAETLSEAFEQQSTLRPHESIITKEGIWLGASWLRVSRGKDQQTGVLAREKELKQLYLLKSTLESKLEEQQSQFDQLRETLQQQEQQCREAQQELNRVTGKFSQLKADEKLKQGRLLHAEQKKDQLQNELGELQQEKQAQHESLGIAKVQWQENMDVLHQQADSRELLQEKKQQIHLEQANARESFNQIQQQAHQLEVQLHSCETQRSSLLQSIERMAAQYNTLEGRKTQLASMLDQGGTPIEELEATRKTLLEKRLLIEKSLQQERETVESLDQQLRQCEKNRHSIDEKINHLRQSLEGLRLESRSSVVRRQTIEEQLQEMNLEVKDVLEKMEAPKSVADLEAQLEHLQRRIDRLGPINLAAIDEYNEKEERKNYLDAQNADLEAALATLEAAIAKIDGETREKFKATYDIVNERFKELFPKIFGGGSAYLELSGNDLLDTGVTVMARPPGKRNSSIHLLSGGEKAMTAIALVFSIFHLNPAPFCMLDEVDAPLDDANVSRFCELVKEMSSKVQFIVITHNKVTMEAMRQLMGVTMHEPGVSRVVSVDVDQAIELAEA
jgi:chromosome segregation protein